jgi:mannan endo-1,4-beta-mannosidase
MKLILKTIWVFLILGIISNPVYSLTGPIKPVTPNASPEVVALLKFFQDNSGKYTLTGQHNYPDIKGRNTRFAAEYIGKTPAIFSSDWGFSKEGDKDSYLARQDIVNEAIRQHKLGSIITICWHAVPPTAKEPVTFQPVPGSNPQLLASVQGRLTDQQFTDLLTPGTELYKNWCSQVDSIAVYLKKLQDAKVPVLWRPYHEMNGSWFWWGARLGKYSTQALYRQIFDRLVKYHKLNNLVWVWSVDRPNKPEMNFSNYYPGNDFLDILALDVYGNDFNQSYYDSLLAISKGKPLVLGEVGIPPTLDILTKQPKWGYYVIWSGMVRNILKKQHKILVSDPRILSLEDPAYWQAMLPFRSACGLPPLPVKNMKVDFSGEWVFNEDKSILDNSGTGNLPYRLKIEQTGNSLSVRKIFIIEEAGDQVTEEVLIQGKVNKSGTVNNPLITTMTRSENGDTLILESKATTSRGNQTVEMITNEKWTLLDQGKTLSITQSSNSFRGKRTITMIYNKI